MRWARRSVGRAPGNGADTQIHLGDRACDVPGFEAGHAKSPSACRGSDARACAMSVS